MSNVYTAAIIRRDEKFLLTQHAHLGRTPLWLMPGGKPESDERALACLVRECREELAIEVTEAVFYRAFLNEVAGKEWVGLFFEVHNFTGEPTIQEPFKHSGLGWFTVEELARIAVGEPEFGLAKYVASLERCPSCRGKDKLNRRVPVGDDGWGTCDDNWHTVPRWRKGDKV